MSDEGPPPPSASAQALQRAQELANLGRWDQVVGIAGEVLAGDPDNVFALCLLSQAEIGLEQYAGAYDRAIAAIRFAPEVEWAQRLAATAASNLGRHPAAIEHAHEAVRLAPFHADGQICLGRTLLRARQVPEARVAADRSVEMAPGDPRTHFLVGAAAAAAGDAKTAEEAFRETLAIDPDNSAAHNELARLQLRRGRRFTTTGLARSATGFSTAVGVDPNAQVALHNLELVLRAFLARGAYLLFLAVWFGHIAAESSASAGRIVAAALLVIPVGFAARFLAQIGPVERRHLVTLLRLDVRVALATAVEIAVVGMAVAAAATDQDGFLVAGIAGALIARVLLYMERRAVR